MRFCNEQTDSVRPVEAPSWVVANLAECAPFWCRCSGLLFSA